MSIGKGLPGVKRLLDHLYRITDYFKALGCTVQRKGLKRPSPSDESGVVGKDRPVTCILQLPLAFPRPRKPRKRKD